MLGAQPDIELALIVSSDAAKVQSDLPGMAVAPELAAALAAPDIELIVIATPNDTHGPLAQAALAAGKHVVIDKPLTTTTAEARALIALADAQRRLLSVFHNRRWDSDFLTVARAIEDGLVGTPRHFESHFDRFRPQVRDRWREHAVPGGGIWFDLGPHLVDQALALFGMPRSVQGSLACQRPGAVVEDWAHVILDYGALRVVLHASMLVAGGVPRFIVHGDGASIVKHGADRQEAQLLAGMTPGSQGWGEDPDALQLVEADGASRPIAALPGDQRRYYAGIAAALRGEAENPVPPQQALAVMAVVEAAAQSAATGRVVMTDRCGEGKPT